VGVRLIEGLRVLSRMPPVRGPRPFGNSWPAHAYEWEDLLAQQQADEEQKRQEQRAQNYVRIQPTAAEITRMEQAIAWPGHYLLGHPQLLRTVSVVAICRARHRDIRHAARRLRLPFDLVCERNRDGLDMIAAGLRREGVRVF
jgi:hypothetical protein